MSALERLRQVFDTVTGRRWRDDEIAHLTQSRVEDQQLLWRLAKLLDERTGERDQARADLASMTRNRDVWRARCTPVVEDPDRQERHAKVERTGGR